jgi:hypothetical protein
MDDVAEEQAPAPAPEPSQPAPTDPASPSATGPKPDWSEIQVKTIGKVRMPDEARTQPAQYELNMRYRVTADVEGTPSRRR